MTGRYEHTENERKLWENMVKTEPINTVNDKCSRCGSCCVHHLPLMPTEIKRIKQYIKTHKIKPCTKFIPPPEHKNEPTLDFTCPFLDNSKSIHRCTIYDTRPAICRSYLCSEREDGSRMTKEVEKEVKSGELTKFDIFNLKDLNTQNIFFPEVYMPKPGDTVTMNYLYLEQFIKQKNHIYIYTGQTRITSNYVIEAFIGNRIEKFWFDINGLSVVHNIENI